MDLLTLAIVAIMILIMAGVLIGLFFTLRSSKSNPTEQKTASNRPDLVEIARLERDKETNMLMVVVDGKLYANASNLSFAQRQRVASAAVDLHKWLGLPPAAAPASTAAIYPPVPAAVLPSVQTITEELPPAPVKPVSTNPVEALRHTIGANKPAPAFKSITAQIDDILQGKLADTPLEKRGIHLAETPGGGVVVQIGLEQYPGIEAVPDEEVRTLIRSAVAEWEKRNK
jgi:hypothetical protein